MNHETETTQRLTWHKKRMNFMIASTSLTGLRVIVSCKERWMRSMQRQVLRQVGEEWQDWPAYRQTSEYMAKQSVGAEKSKLAISPRLFEQFSSRIGGTDIITLSNNKSA
jgi:hypothetical protein